MFSTIQDYGRSGWQHKGIPVGGALDRNTFDQVNTILGNDLNTPVIEATIIGPTLYFDSACRIAVSGSLMRPKIDNEVFEMNHVIQIEGGQTLSFERMSMGCRTYIGIGGEWHIKRWLGSVSPMIYGVNYDLQSSILKKGQTIHITTNQNELDIKLKVKSDKALKDIYCHKGPEFNLFGQSTIDLLLKAEYKIHQNSNRMGYRLTGNHIRTPDKKMISSAVLPGTVQITNEGAPIILLNDAQTTGGYPRIFQLDQHSINLLAHKKPGDVITFKLLKNG